MTIEEFIEARLAEDEVAAKGARPGPWIYDGYSCGPQIGKEWLMVDDGTHEPRSDVIPDEDSAHIARHDPARVLRQCAAVRRVIDAEMGHISNLDGEFGDGCTPATIRAGQCEDPDNHPDKSETMRALAAVWCDHPDYDPSWAVDGGGSKL